MPNNFTLTPLCGAQPDQAGQAQQGYGVLQIWEATVRTVKTARRATSTTLVVTKADRSAGQRTCLMPSFKTQLPLDLSDALRALQSEVCTAGLLSSQAGCACHVCCKPVPASPACLLGAGGERGSKRRANRCGRAVRACQAGWSSRGHPRRPAWPICPGPWQLSFPGLLQHPGRC